MLVWDRSIMENLLTASLTIPHKISFVTGEKERKRSAVEMSRPSGAGASSVADRTSETFWSKKSAKASAERPVAGCEAPSPPLPSPSLIVRQRDAGSRRVSIWDLQERPLLDRTSRCIDPNASTQCSRTAVESVFL